MQHVSAAVTVQDVLKRKPGSNLSTIMGRLIPTLAARLAQGRRLREWCRLNLLAVELPKDSPPETVKGSPRKKENSDKIDGILRNHKIVDSFFGGLGFPALRKNHPLERQWKKQLEAVRREEKLQRPKRRRRRKSAKKDQDSAA